MSISLATWKTLMEHAPFGCSATLVDMQRKGDLDSIRLAIDAGVASDGPSATRASRAISMLPLLETGGGVVVDRFFKAMQDEAALTEVLHQAVRHDKHKAMQATIAAGADPYFAIENKDSNLQKGRMQCAFDVMLSRGQGEARNSWGSLFPSLRPESFLRKIDIAQIHPLEDKRPVEERVAVPPDYVNFLEMVILRGFSALSEDIRNCLETGADYSNVYRDLGERARRILKVLPGGWDETELAAQATARPQFSLPKDSLRVVTGLLVNGAKFDSAQELESVLWRSVSGYSSILFPMLKIDNEAHSNNYRYGHSRETIYHFFEDLICEKGLDVNRTNRDGASFLMAAVAAGHPKLVHLLLENGADPCMHMEGENGEENLLIKMAKKRNPSNSGDNPILSSLHAAIAKKAMTAVIRRSSP